MCINQIQLKRTHNDYTPESSAAHLSVSAYSNSKSGDSDSPCAEGVCPILTNYLLEYTFTKITLRNMKKLDVLNGTSF